MPPVYRSQVARCWEVTHTHLPPQHFFAFGLQSNPDAISKYGIISASPSQGVMLESQDIDLESSAPHANRRPLPRSICRLILTGKPLVISVLKLQAKRSHLQAPQSLATVVVGQSDLAPSLQQELWAIDGYLDRLYQTISQLYRQVVYETELIQFDAIADDDRLEEADSRAEHVERLLDSFEHNKRQDKRPPWFVPKMLHRHQ